MRPDKRQPDHTHPCGLTRLQIWQSTQRGHDARGIAQRARTAWRKAEKDFDAAVQTVGVIKQVERALAILRPDGELNDRQWAQEQLRTAPKPLGGPEWGKVRRLLSDERTLQYLDWLHEPLTAAVEDPLRRAACPFSQKTQTHFFSSVCELAITRSIS
jgi:hypothetical protein